ncbi:MAG: hypothetical protein WCC17_07545 [Candidatus Nitrosopolaris sp.]
MGTLRNIPDGMKKELFKVFQKYNVGDKAMLCLWRNAQLNCALREPSRQHEIENRLREWLEDG